MTNVTSRWADTRWADTRWADHAVGGRAVGGHVVGGHTVGGHMGPPLRGILYTQPLGGILTAVGGHTVGGHAVGGRAVGGHTRWADTRWADTRGGRTHGSAPTNPRWGILTFGCVLTILKTANNLAIQFTKEVAEK